MGHLPAIKQSPQTREMANLRASQKYQINLKNLQVSLTVCLQSKWTEKKRLKKFSKSNSAHRG